MHRVARAQLLALEKEGIFTAAAPGKWEGKAGTHVPSAAKGDDGAVVVTIKVRTHSLTRSLPPSLTHLPPRVSGGRSERVSE